MKKLNGKVLLSATVLGIVSICATSAYSSTVKIVYGDGDAVDYYLKENGQNGWNLFSDESCSDDSRVLPPSRLYNGEDPFSLDSQDPSGLTLYTLKENRNPASDNVFTVTHRGLPFVDAYEFTGFNNVYVQCTNQYEQGVTHVRDCEFTFRGVKFTPSDFFSTGGWPDYSFFSRGGLEFKNPVLGWSSNLFSFVECDFTEMPSGKNPSWGVSRFEENALPPGLQFSFKNCEMASVPIQNNCDWDFQRLGSTIDLVMDGCHIFGYIGDTACLWGDVLVTNCVYETLGYWQDPDCSTYGYGRIFYNGNGMLPAVNSYGENCHREVTDCVILSGVYPAKSLVALQNGGDVKIGTIWMDKDKSRPYTLRYQVYASYGGEVLSNVTSQSGIAYKDPSKNLYATASVEGATDVELTDESGSTLSLLAVPGMTELWFRLEVGGGTAWVSVPWPDAVYRDEKFETPYDITTPIPSEGLKLYYKSGVEDHGGAKDIDDKAESPLSVTGFAVDPADPAKINLVAKPTLKTGVEGKAWADKSNEYGKFKIVTGTDVRLFTAANIATIIGGGTVEGLSVLDATVEYTDDGLLKLVLERDASDPRRFYRFVIVD